MQLAVRLNELIDDHRLILPAEVAARLRVKEGDSLSVTETPDGVQLSPYDPEFEKAMEAFERGRVRYRNALRRLAK